MAKDILLTCEIDKFVEEYEVFNLEDIGKKRWFNHCATFMKLYQVATLEASLNGIERVKDAISRDGKIEYFIKELIILSVWKEKVLPELLKMKPIPQHSIPTYLILYKEVTLIGMLQLLLYYSEMLNDIIDTTFIDLIDYCVYKLATINSDDLPIVAEMKLETNAIEDLQRHNKNLNFITSTYCMSLLRFICENLQSLPLNVASRIYTVHDVPLLITQLLDNNTWSRMINGKLYKYSNNTWKEWFRNDPPLSEVEIQMWLLIHQLLLNSTCRTVYTFSGYRMEQLSKLVRYLHEDVTNHLCPLADLKHWLLSNCFCTDEVPRTDNPLIVEISHQFRDTIYESYEGKWHDIALARSKLLFYADSKELKFIANGFSGFVENVDTLTNNLRTCFNCYNKALKKCSKCKKACYCSRKCQVEHWSAHKNTCNI